MLILERELTRLVAAPLLIYSLLGLWGVAFLILAGIFVGLPIAFLGSLST